MKSASFLSYVYGFGIVVMLFFLWNEAQAFRLRLHSLDAVIPSFAPRVTAPPAPRVYAAVEHESRPSSANLAEAVSSWIREDAYPPMGTVDQPYDERDGIPSPTVAEVGWWGGEQE